MSDRSKYSSALPWFRIVLKQRDFASFGRMGIARKIERAGETAGLPFSVHVHRMAGRRADLQPRWARASRRSGRDGAKGAPRTDWHRLHFQPPTAAYSGRTSVLWLFGLPPSPLRRISQLLDRIDDRGSARHL